MIRTKIMVQMVQPITSKYTNCGSKSHKLDPNVYL